MVPSHAVPWLAAALAICIGGSIIFGSQLGVQQVPLQDRCRSLVNQFGPGWDLTALPESFKEQWVVLHCDVAWPGARISTSSSNHQDAAGTALDWGTGGTDADVTNKVNEMDVAMMGSAVCKKPCTDSWSPGVWAHHCEQDQQCVFNFVPEGQDCMYEIFSKESTAACMQNKWLVLLGSSGAMNLALSWLQALDPAGTAPPFEGPRWYNWHCYKHGNCTNEALSSEFVNYKNMKIDIIIGPTGSIIWKGGRYDALSDAPVVPIDGWRLTALPVQWAVEVKTTIRNALRFSRFESFGGRGPAPIVYVQIGQWHLNAFDGKSIKWLAKTKKWGINATELYGWAKVPTVPALTSKFHADMLDMVQALRRWGIDTLALAGMPTSGHKCSKHEGLGCRAELNAVIQTVVNRYIDVPARFRRHAQAEALPDGAKVRKVFYVEWDTISKGEQAAAHSNHKAAVMGIQRLLSVLCAPQAHSAAGQVISTVSRKKDVEGASELRKRYERLKVLKAEAKKLQTASSASRLEQKKALKDRKSKRVAKMRSKSDDVGERAPASKGLRGAATTTRRSSARRRSRALLAVVGDALERRRAEGGQWTARKYREGSGRGRGGRFTSAPMSHGDTRHAGHGGEGRAGEAVAEGRDARHSAQGRAGDGADKAMDEASGGHAASCVRMVKFGYGCGSSLGHGESTGGVVATSEPEAEYCSHSDEGGLGSTRCAASADGGDEIGNGNGNCVGGGEALVT